MSALSPSRGAPSVVFDQCSRPLLSLTLSAVLRAWQVVWALPSCVCGSLPDHNVFSWKFVVVGGPPAEPAPSGALFFLD